MATQDLKIQGIRPAGCEPSKSREFDKNLRSVNAGDLRREQRLLDCMRGVHDMLDRADKLARRADRLQKRD
jgi:hypothetical protein